MRLLLDTNVLIDFSTKGESYSFSEQDLFDAAVGTGPFLVSFVSIWEIEIKTRLKKLALTITIDQLCDMVKVAGGIMIDMGRDHVLAKLDVEPSTKDPFDRLLLTTAAAEGAVLVTRDRALQSHPLAWKPGLMID
jgi:PIN domain nuclease of toxin-antitoxin system